jgi:hypothetical protein
LDLIDRAWRGRKLLAVTELFATVRETLDLEELAELLAADSEWRWRLAGFSELTPAPAGCDWGDSRPRMVETYLAEIPDLAESPDAIRMLVESEFMARSRWGNPPLIAEFVERFPYLEGIDISLRENLDDLSMVFVRRLTQLNSAQLNSAQASSAQASSAQANSAQAKSVWANGQEEHLPLPVRTPLSIGRQSMKEPRDTFLLPERNRLIIVDNYQHGVSRQHAMLTRQAIDRCWIANISPFGEMKVNDQGFPPGSRMLALFPLLVEIGGVRLKFFTAK